MLRVTGPAIPGRWVGTDGMGNVAWLNPPPVAEVVDTDVADLLADPTSATATRLAATFPQRRAALTIRIPTDAPNLQVALDSLNPAHIDRGATIEVRFEAGHRPTRGARIAGDYSAFRITSTDPVVTVAATFTGDFLRCDNGNAPRLACLVDMADRGGEGYMLVGSTGHVEPQSGIRNAGARGLYVGSASTCTADYSEFTGSNNRNVWVTRASALAAEYANFSANKGGENAVYISRASQANIGFATVTDAFLNAIVSTRSMVTATEADVSRAGGIGLLCGGGGFLHAQGAVANGCGQYGAAAYHDSAVLVRTATITGNGLGGARSLGGSRIDCRTAIVSGNGNARDLIVMEGSQISAHGATTTRGTPPVAADTNVTALNAITSAGIIFA
ncbi:hypothetical protein [Ornithinimicrobium sufpigmenti]|uniref:hypothetical protein n=1 Tax=Ornithinimicrobium sufpigmenti TaxID=2508882 RepID=UPI001035D524|nr:hypothetical protein [Ornithinimicrobium sp. HY006]